MRIKIIVDDWYLKNWYGLPKGATRSVVRIVYVNKKRINPEEIVGYRVMVFDMQDHNFKGRYTEIFIRNSECKVLPDYKKLK